MPRKAQDLSGMKFGRLTVVKFSHRDKNKFINWLCKCGCGNETVVTGASLKNGFTQSCGCLFKENISKSHLKHGMCGTRIYTCWVNMKNRCLNPKNDNFKYYGARGIAICDEWNNDFMAFKEWSDNNGYRENLTIDRINNDGNYEPSNCRWTTIAVQSLNKRQRKPNEKPIIINPKKEYIEKLKIKYKDKVKTRLTKSDILEIKNALELGISGSEIARILKVSRQTVNNIKLNKININYKGYK